MVAWQGRLRKHLMLSKTIHDLHLPELFDEAWRKRAGRIGWQERPRRCSPAVDIR